MRYTVFLFVLLISCGTTGHIAFYNFKSSKYEIQREIAEVLNSDSTYRVPSKWREHTQGDYFERIYVYFKSHPEEIYQIGFTGDSNSWNQSSTSRLGLISIYQGNLFKYEGDLSSKEQERVQKRFESEILSQIKTPFEKSY